MVVNRVPRITEPKVGPEPGGIRMCIKCSRPIAPGQPWTKVHAPGGDYAVGMCNGCLAQTLQPLAYRCNQCGYGSNDKLTMIVHLGAAHAVTAPDAIIAALR
jgi:hypothetical protein